MTIKQGFPDRLFRSSVVPSDFLAVNEYSDLALAETNARGNPVAANGATRSALADATAPISENARSIGLRVREITSSPYTKVVQYSSGYCSLVSSRSARRRISNFLTMESRTLLNVSVSY